MKKTPLIFVVVLCLLAACSQLEFLKGGQSSAPSPVAANLTDQGYALITRQQLRPAVAIFDQAIAQDPENIRAYQGKGIALNKLGKHGEAEAVYEQALKIEPDAVGILNNLAMSKILRGKYREAIALLQPLASSDPENDTVQENMALASCLLGKNEDAKKLYSKRLSSKEVEENLSFCKQYKALRKTP